MKFHLARFRGMVHAKDLFLFLLLLAMILVSCSSGKSVQNKTTAIQANASETLCSRTVRYYIEKSIVTADSGEEKEDNKSVEITLNPSDGQLVMKGTQSEHGEKATIILESCNLAAGMQHGEAIYTTSDEKLTENGNTIVTTVSIKVEASNGAVTFSIYAPGKKGGIKAAVAKWEVVE